MGYDIIGDIHGHATELEALLAKLGYEEKSGAYRHPDGRQVVFLGDYIDRGPRILRTLEIVRGMVDTGNAYAIMGNHEMNALHYATRDPLSKKADPYLRTHTEAHHKQCAATFAQLDGPAMAYWLEWMMKLPLWLKLKDKSGTELRFIHAAWNENDIHRFWEGRTSSGAPLLTGSPDAACFTPEGLMDAGRRRDPVTGKTPLSFKLKSALITGPEAALPKGQYYYDKEGTERRAFRIRWWLKSDHKTSLVDMMMAGQRSRMTLADAGADVPFTVDFRPYPILGFTFFGHYWLDPEELGPLTDRIACLDFSVAKGGLLAAYRYEPGDTVLSKERFVTVPAVTD